MGLGLRALLSVRRAPRGTDDGPVSYLTLRPGTPVRDRFGDETGSVERVLTLDGPHFDGIVVRTASGSRFVDAPEVRRIEPAAVTLCITTDDVIAHRFGRTEIGERDRTAAVEALKRAYVADLIDAHALADRIEQTYVVETLDELERLLSG